MKIKINSNDFLITATEAELQIIMKAIDEAIQRIHPHAFATRVGFSIDEAMSVKQKINEKLQKFRRTE